MAEDKQLTVAELLARARKDNPDAGTPKRRRRRSLEDGGISVAELTGSFPAVTDAPPQAKHTAVSIDGDEKPSTPAKTPKPEPKKPEPTPAAVTPEAKKPEGKPSVTKPAETKKPAEAKKPEVKTPAAKTPAAKAPVATPAETKAPAAKKAAEAKKPEPKTPVAKAPAAKPTEAKKPALKTPAAKAPATKPAEPKKPGEKSSVVKPAETKKPEPKKPEPKAPVAKPAEAKKPAAKTPAPAKKPVDAKKPPVAPTKPAAAETDDDAKTGVLKKVDAQEPKTAADTKRSAVEAPVASSTPKVEDTGVMPAVNDSAEGGNVRLAERPRTDVEEETEEESGGSPGAVIGMAVVGVVLGAVVFFVFEMLWGALNPWLTGALALLVTVAMIFTVRALRTARDSMTMTLAGLVGLVTTFGPALIAL